jgi:hypothetical protein
MRNILSVVLCLGLLAGCSAKVSGGDDSGGPAGLGLPSGGGGDFSNKVTGPTIDGHWLSTCVSDGFGEHATYDITYSAPTAQKLKIVFNDAACTAEKSRKLENGVFRFNEKLSGDVFIVEYKMAMHGGSYTQINNVKRVGDSLFVTDISSGEGFPPDIELKLVGPAVPSVPGAPGTPGVAGLTPFIGQWTSACVLNSSGLGARSVFTVRANSTVIRDDVVYSDQPKCARASSHAEKKIAGTLSGTVLSVGTLLLALTDAKTLTADAASGLGALTLIGQPQALASYAPVYAASCPQFAGSWQMNDFYFTVKQDGCERISLTGAGVPENVSTFYDFDFMPDGQLWTRNLRTYISTTASFSADFLQNVYSYKNSSGVVQVQTDKWFFSKDPCNLQNPSGENYLVRQSWDHQTGAELACEYYSRWQ